MSVIQVIGRFQRGDPAGRLVEACERSAMQDGGRGRWQREEEAKGLKMEVRTEVTCQPCVRGCEGKRQGFGFRAVRHTHHKTHTNTLPQSSSEANGVMRQTQNQTWTLV